MGIETRRQRRKLSPRDGHFQQHPHESGILGEITEAEPDEYYHKSVSNKGSEADNTCRELVRSKAEAGQENENMYDRLEAPQDSDEEPDPCPEKYRDPSWESHLKGVNGGTYHIADSDKSKISNQQIQEYESFNFPTVEQRYVCFVNHL